MSWNVLVPSFSVLFTRRKNPDEPGHDVYDRLLYTHNFRKLDIFFSRAFFSVSQKKRANGGGQRMAKQLLWHQITPINIHVYI